MDEYYKAKEIVNGYTVLKVIGEGRYGIAYLAINKKDEKCVIKQLKRDMLEENREKAIYEEKNLQRLNSPKFPKFISKFRDGKKEGYILEYIEGKVFEDIIIKERHEFSRKEIYETASQLLELIEILHSNKIVHRDIRPPNVILKQNNELALIDFGLSRIIDDKRYVKDVDYWFLGDFLLYLYYSSYKETSAEERPWFEELDLTADEENLLKRLLGIEEIYQNADEIKNQLEKIKTTDSS